MKNVQSTQVFIIRIWRELREKPGLSPELRGMIEHLQSQKKVYFDDLDEVNHFMGPYLEEIGLPQTGAHPDAKSAVSTGRDLLRCIFDALRGIKRNE